MRRAHGPLVVLGLGAALLASARPAAAEEIVLASGARYDAKGLVLNDGVDGKDGTVRFTYLLAGGSATLELPWARIDPWSLVALKAARVPANDGRGMLEVARLAATSGLEAEAARRYRRAAELDPTLAPERDAGLRALADASLTKALAAAESDLKRGRSDLALAATNDVLAKADPASPIAARAKAVGELAGRVLETDRARNAAADAARDAAAADAEKAAFLSALSRADAAILGAIDDRAKAGDPTLNAIAARTALEAAEARFREGRRLLASARTTAGSRLSEVDARDKDALSLLVATDLDLADLFRHERRFDRARDHLRAAQILDPTNPRIAEIRDRIEQDLRTPPVYDEPLDSGFTTGTYFGGYGYVPGFSYGTSRGHRGPVYGSPYRGRTGSSGGFFGSGGFYGRRWSIR